MAHDVFISYSHRDKEIADAICATLERKRIRCWIAPRDVLPGISYGESIIDAINHASVMILVFSNHSNNSQQVEREVERAVSKGVTIIPFRLEDVPLSKSMEYFISSPHWLDAMTPPLESHIEYLSETIKILLSRLRNSQREQQKTQDLADFPEEENEKTNGKIKPSLSALGFIHINDENLTPKHHSDYVEIHFSISNFSRTIQKIPHVWLRIIERQEINKMRLKKAGAMIQEYQLSAQIEDSDVDILANSGSQLIIQPDTSDTFCLQLFGPEGYHYLVTLVGEFHDLKAGSIEEIVSKPINIEYPIRTIDTLRRRDKQ